MKARVTLKFPNGYSLTVEAEPDKLERLIERARTFMTDAMPQFVEGARAVLQLQQNRSMPIYPRKRDEES